jgi:hypothetical protein
MPTAREHLKLAKEQLARVLAAWPDPTDWSDLTIYGFYCLENAVVAAAVHAGLSVPPVHNAKAKVSAKLAKSHGLPDVSRLLLTLNAARKATSYGDIVLPVLNAQDLAREIEGYVDAVEQLVP